MDPRMQEVLAEVARWPAPPASPQSMWALRAGQYRETAFGPAYEEVAEVVEHVVDGRDGPLRVKAYTPRNAGRAPTPALLRIHGGGMVIGAPEFEDRTSRALANALGARVFAVAYRLAPEHPWPAALHDCLDALRWLHAEAPALGADPGRLAVLGHSAGGMLALACAIALRDTEPRVRRYVALEPATGPRIQTPSRARYGDGAYLLDMAQLDRWWDLYLAGAHPIPATAAPAHATDAQLRGLDPVAILTAEHDPLRDEGEAFAHRLAAAGVDVEQRRFDGLVHGSLTFMGRVPAARTVFEAIVRTLHDAFRL